MEKATSNRHIPVLDGLRGIAILLVMLCHVNWCYGGPFVSGRVNGPVAMVFGWGWIGVDLFFVLSGFLITGILFDAKGSDGFFRNFYARRTLRIMPLYFGFLFFCLLVLPLLANPLVPQQQMSGGDVLSLLAYYYNWRFAIIGRGLGYFHPFWSLALEEHFYLLWPFVVWALGRRTLMRVCIVVAGSSFILRVFFVAGTSNPLAGFFLTPSRLDGLLAGAWLALARRDTADWATVQQWAGKLVIASGCLLLGIALGQRHFIPDAKVERGDVAINANLVLTVGLSILAFFFAGLLALAVGARNGSFLRRFLENKGLCAIGKYSYGIYVFHALILAIGVRVLSLSFEMELFLAKPFAVVWGTAVSFGVAWLSYHLYEKHFLRLKRHFEYRQCSAVESSFSAEVGEKEALVPVVSAVEQTFSNA